MIIYIHGFGSSGLGEKAQLFRKRFAPSLIAPSLPVSPDLAIDSLRQIVERCMKYEPVALVGSSLGGYYGQYLSKLYGLKLVAINPVTEPGILHRHIGKNSMFYDKTVYEYTPEHFKQLQTYEARAESENLFLFLQKDDETLDYRVALQAYPEAKKVLTSGGGHAFLEIESYFREIEEFLI